LILISALRQAAAQTYQRSIGRTAQSSFLIDDWLASSSETGARWTLEVAGFCELRLAA